MGLTGFAIAGSLSLIAHGSNSHDRHGLGPALIQTPDGIPWLSDLLSWTLDPLTDYLTRGFAFPSMGPLYLLCVIGLFLLGTVLPDIDQKLRIRHRGWTHTDFFVIALLLLGMIPILRLVTIMAFGVMTHLFLDGRSRAGRVRFYPIQKHRVITYPDGTRCVVRPHRYNRGYTVGDRSETVVFIRVLVICAVLLVICTVFAYPYMDHVYPYHLPDY